MFGISLAFLSLFVSCKSKTRAVEASEQGVFLVANGVEVKTLDPNLSASVAASRIIKSLFEGLAYDHPTQDGVAVPAAAKSWSCTEDCKLWTFNLQENAKWSDGTPVTTEDFLFSYQRILSPRLASRYSAMLYVIENAEAFNKGKITDFSKVGVWAEGDYTLKVKLHSPVPFLPEYTKHGTWFPIPKHIVLKHGAIDDPFSKWSRAENIVSNGPFRMKERRLNDFLKVEKSPYYWDKANLALNEIHFFPIQNHYTESRMFADGLLHKTYMMPGEIYPSYQKNFTSETRRDVRYATRMIRFNTTDKLLQDVKLREALSLAINRKSYINSVKGVGGANRASSMVPASKYYQSQDFYQFNLDKAKQRLAESSYATNGDFPELTILIVDSDSLIKEGEILQGMFAELGVQTRISKCDWATYQTRQNQMDYQICITGWFGDYLDPTTFLDMWTEGNGNNHTGWSSQEYEAKLKQAAQIVDPIKRAQKLMEAETILLESYSVLSVYWYKEIYLVSDLIENWNSFLLGEMPYKYVKFKNN